MQEKKEIQTMSFLPTKTLLHHVLLIPFFNLGVWAYPQQPTSSASASDQASSITTPASIPIITAVLSTVALAIDSFNIGGDTISGLEQDFTTISVLGISSDTGSNESETTYYREIVNSVAEVTTTTGGQLIANTLIPGDVYTYNGEPSFQSGFYEPMTTSPVSLSDVVNLPDTIVENASGYRQFDSVNTTVEGTTLNQYEYQTCSFDSVAGTGGCSIYESYEIPTSGGTIVTESQSFIFTGSAAATTMTVPFQAAVTSSPSSSGSSSASSPVGTSSNGAISYLGAGKGSFRILTMYLLVVVVSKAI